MDWAYVYKDGVEKCTPIRQYTSDRRWELSVGCMDKRAVHRQYGLHLHGARYIIYQHDQ